MSHSTLIMGPERRRRWSAEAKRAVLEAAFAPGAIVVEVAREFEISTSLIYKWRQEAIGMSAAPAFAPALLVVFRLAKMTPISGISASQNDPLSLRL